MTEKANIVELMGGLDFDPAALKSKYLAERDKRLRDDANEQYVEVTAEFSLTTSTTPTLTPATLGNLCSILSRWPSSVAASAAC